jgi:hypothetical protein
MSDRVRCDLNSVPRNVANGFGALSGYLGWGIRYTYWSIREIHSAQKVHRESQQRLFLACRQVKGNGGATAPTSPHANG